MPKNKEPKTSIAQRKAIKKYDEKFERINTRLPIGTIEKIKSTGAKSINGFIVDAIEEKLVYTGTQEEAIISHMKALKEMDEMTEEEIHFPPWIYEEE